MLWEHNNNPVQSASITQWIYLAHLWTQPGRHVSQDSNLSAGLLRGAAGGQALFLTSAEPSGKTAQHEPGRHSAEDAALKSVGSQAPNGSKTHKSLEVCVASYYRVEREQRYKESDGECCSFKTSPLHPAHTGARNVMSAWVVWLCDNDWRTTHTTAFRKGGANGTSWFKHHRNWCRTINLLSLEYWYNML